MSTFFFKTVARLVLFSYSLQIVNPAYAGFPDTPEGVANFRARLKAKIKAVDPFAENPSNKSLPTLTLQTTQAENGERWGLTVTETHFDGTTSRFITDYAWKETYGPTPQATRLDHPWQRVLDLYFSDGALTARTVPQINQQTPYYVPYNYVFNTAATPHLTLLNLVTPGFVDVKNSALLTTKHVEAHAGVRLKSQQEIRNTGDDEEDKACILSNGPILLKTPLLDTQKGHIEGEAIFGVLGSKNLNDVTSLNTSDGVLNANKTQIFNGGTVFNQEGKIGGKSLFDFYSEGMVKNRSGQLWSKGNTTFQADAMDNTEGAEVSGKNLILRINQQIHTDKTSHLMANQKISLKADTVQQDSPLSAPTVEIQTNQDLILGAPQCVEDLHLSVENGASIDYSKLFVRELFHLTLPEKATTLVHGINIPGRLVVDRAGNSDQPLHILQDLITAKGIEICLPPAELLLGAESDTQPMVKVQAKEGAVKLNARSLDIVKAQLYSKTGLDLTVQEKEIHIGRGVMESIPMIEHLRSFCSISRDFPFKSSNGTLLLTKGDFSLISPEGVWIDSAEIDLQGKGTQTIITEQPVRNEGGKLTVSGNLRIDSPPDVGNSNAIFQNYLATHTSPFRFLHTSYSLTHPYSKRAQFRIEGDLEVKAFENFGSSAFIGGKLLSPTREPIKPQETPFVVTTTMPYYGDFTAFINHRLYSLWFRVRPPLQPIVESNITFGSEAVLDFPKEETDAGSKNHSLQGIVQAPKLLITFDGKLEIGQRLNYRRPAIPPFQPILPLVQVHGGSAFYQDDLNSPNPWIRCPVVPMSWNIPLPPAVVVTAQGLQLKDDQAKFLFCPWEEVSMLANAFEEQLQRGCLDWEHRTNLESYVFGRHQAYKLYQERFAPKALPTTMGPEVQDQALIVYSQNGLTKALGPLTPEEQEALKFMVLYYAAPYENHKAVYMPISWLSKGYDNPLTRNADGGAFAEELFVVGQSPEAVLHNFATLFGRKVNQIEVAKVINERTSYTYLTYRTNTTYKKGRGWFGSDEHFTEIVAIPCSEAQPTTGLILSGEEGEVTIEAAELDNRNGAEIKAGAKGQKLIVGTLNSTPAFDTYPVSFQLKAKGFDATVHGVGARIVPAQITSTGGIEWEVERLNLTGTHIIEREKNIDMVVEEEGHLHPALQTFLANVTAEGGRKTTTVQTTHTQIASPTVIAALQGDVHLHAKKFMDGVAPVIFGKNIDLKGKFDLSGMLLRNTFDMNSRTESTFSSSHTMVHREDLYPLLTIIEAQESITLDGEMNLPGTHLKAEIIHLKPDTDLIMDSVVQWAHDRQETNTRSPLSRGNAGFVRSRQVQAAPQIKGTKLIQDNPHGVIRLTNAVLNVEEIQAHIETFVRPLLSQQKEWSNDDQFLPQPLVVAAVMLATYYTGGLAGPGLVGAMLNAVIKTIVSMGATSLLQTGDPEQTIERITSRNGLRAMGESMAVNGILHTVAPSLTSPGQLGFVNHLKNAALTNGVKATVQSAMGKSAEIAFVHGLKQTALETAAATGANTIALNVENPVVHTVALGGVAAGLDLATGGNRKTAFSAGGAAITTATLAGVFIDPDKIMGEVKSEGHPEKDHQKVFEKKREDLIALISAGTVGLTMAFGGDQAAATFAADNVLRHDVALRMAMPQRPVLQPNVNPAPPEEENEEKKARKAAQRKKQAKIRKAREEAARKKKQDDLAHKMVVQQLLSPSPQETFQQELFEIVAELALEERQEQKKSSQAPKSVLMMDPGFDSIYPALEKTTVEEIKGNVPRLWRKYVEYCKEDLRRQANRDSLQEIACLPIPGAGMAAFAYEGREIYRGNQTLGGAAVDMVVGIVAGKLVIAVGKKVIEGGKYVWKSAKSILPTRGVTRPPHQVAKHNNFVSSVKDPTRGFWYGREFTTSGILPLAEGRDLVWGGRGRTFRGSRYDSKAPYMVNSHGTPDSIELHTKVFSPLKTDEPLFKSIKDLSPLKRTSKLTPRAAGARPFPIEPLKKSLKVVDIVYELNHRQFVMLLKKQEGYKKGQPVMLFACSTGKKKHGFAKNTANKLGGPVQAPTGPIWNAYYEPYFKVHVPAKVTIDIPEFILKNNFIKRNKLASYLIDKIKYPGDKPIKYFHGKVKTFYPGKPIYSGKGHYSGGYREKLEKDVVFYSAIVGGAIGIIGFGAQSLSLLDNEIPLHYHKVPDKNWENYTEDDLKILEAKVEELHSRYALTQSGKKVTTMAPGSEFIYPALEEINLEKSTGNVQHLWDMYKQDWKDGLKSYTDMDYLKIFSYLPLPGAGTAALACEGREIYRGTQTFGGAAFDMVVGIVVGKTVIWAGNKAIAGMKYVWQTSKDFALTGSLKMVQNYRDYGVFSPKKFRTEPHLSESPPFKLLTREEVLSGKYTDLIYVITEKGELRIISNSTKPYLDTYYSETRGCFVTTISDSVGHARLGHSEPVLGAGEVGVIKIHNNIYVDVSSVSGCYCPESKTLAKLTKSVVEKNGYLINMLDIPYNPRRRSPTMLPDTLSWDNITKKISAFFRNEQGAGKGLHIPPKAPQTVNLKSWKELNRDIYKEGLGKNIGGVKAFSARLSMKSPDVAHMFVRGIEGRGINVRGVMNNLQAIGRETGAKVLEIEGMITDTKFKDYLIKHYHLTPGDHNWDKLPLDFKLIVNVKNWDKITIPLTPGKAPQPVNLKGGAKPTGKIASFLHDETGAGRGFSKPTTFSEKRPLRPEDIGQKADDLDIIGTIQRHGKKIFIKLGWVRNTSMSYDDIVTNRMYNNGRLKKPKTPLPTGFVETMMNQLTSRAKAMGATTLHLEIWPFNPRLSAILSKRYNRQALNERVRRGFENLFITIPLTPQRATDLRMMKGGAKITGKILSFIDNEKGAGKNIVSGVLGLGKKALEGGKYVWKSVVKPKLFHKTTAANKNIIGASPKSELDTFVGELPYTTSSTENILDIEAAKRFLSYFSRPLTLQDVGANPGTLLKGSFSQINDAVEICIDVFAHGNDRALIIMTVMKNLIKTAQEKGAKTLTIEGALVDSQFKKYVRQNHTLPPGEHWFEKNKVTISVVDR